MMCLTNINKYQESVSLKILSPVAILSMQNTVSLKMITGPFSVIRFKFFPETCHIGRLELSSPIVMSRNHYRAWWEL